MNAVTQLAPAVGIESACDVLGVARATFYRHHPLLKPELAPVPPPVVIVRPTSPRAVPPDEGRRCAIP